MRRLLSLALAGAMFLSLLGTAYAGNHENGTNQTRAFSKRITGTVVAADGVVRMVWYNHSAYDSDGSLGWYLYRSFNYGSTINGVYLNIKRMTFSDLLKTLGMVSS